MKTKLLIAFLLIVSVFAFISTRTSSENKSGMNRTETELPEAKDQFITGATDDAFDLDYSMIQDIGLNMWHQYSAPMNKGWLLPSGGYDPSDNINSTGVPSNVGYRLDENKDAGIYSLMDRPKLEYLAYGQMSEYQCEEIGENEDYWFYSYSTHEVGDTMTDHSQHGNGERVRHCTTNDGQGWIVKDLKSNREQANYKWNQWNNDDTYKWFIMPKIRIKPEDTVTNKRVCRIDIVNWNDSVILNVEIGSRNFRDNSNTYSGNYLKQYYDLLTNLEFGPGRMLNPEDKFFHDWGETCHIDFRVYYYNECEMWIDYVKLENLPAHELLTVHDATRENWILQETENALSHGGNSSWRFYIEEFEFNTVPCVGYLNNVIDSIARLQGKDLSLMVNLNYDLFQAHIPFYYDWTDPMTAQDIDHYLIKKGKLKEVFIGSYPLQGYGDDNIHPNNLYYHNQLPPPTYHSGTLN